MAKPDGRTLPAKTATDRMEAARAVKNAVLDREMMLVSLITRMPGWTSYLCSPIVPQQNFPFMVCVETPAGMLMWRVHRDEMQLFSHLKARVNTGAKQTSEDKLLTLQRLATDGWS